MAATKISLEMGWCAAIDKLPSSLLSRIDKESMKQWIIESKSKHIEILVTGRTGAGKSTLVNGLCGSPAVPAKPKTDQAHSLKPETMSIEKHSFTTSEGYEIVVWDSPGLQDGTGNEAQYLAEMKEKCSNVDIVIYCITTAATRCELAPGQKDYTAIQKLTSTFGVEWWKNSVFVLTFANTLESMQKAQTKDPNDREKKFNDSIAEWEDKIREAINTAGIPPEIADKIPIETAGYIKKPHLPGRQYWHSHLWFVFAKRMKKESQPVLVKLNANRIKTISDTEEKDFTSKESYEQPIVSNVAHATGIAATIIGGTVAGAGIGALAGLPGAGVGALIGGAVGGVTGGALAIVTLLIIYMG